VGHLESSLVDSLKPDESLGKNGYILFDADDPNLLFVNSISDEYHFWAMRAQNSRFNKIDQETAAHYKSILQSIAKDFEILQYILSYARSLSDQDVIDLAERCHDCLDDLWRQQEFEPYPQERMVHVLNLITDDFTGYIQFNLFKVNLFTDEWSSIAALLLSMKQLCESWILTLDTLTGKIWPNSIGHSWKGEPFTSLLAVNMAENLNKVIFIKSDHQFANFTSASFAIGQRRRQKAI
jgi:dynein heavy chain 2